MYRTATSRSVSKLKVGGASKGTWYKVSTDPANTETVNSVQLHANQIRLEYKVLQISAQYLYILNNAFIFSYTFNNHTAEL